MANTVKLHCTSRQVYDDSRGNDGRCDDGRYGRVATDPSRGTGCGASGGEKADATGGEKADVTGGDKADVTGGEKADATGSEKVASEVDSG